MGLDFYAVFLPFGACTSVELLSFCDFYVFLLFFFVEALYFFDLVVFGEMQEMGVISRKLFPACGSMCVCCPALRSRSRQPVKRYKKLIADIFPKSPVSMELYILSLCSFGCVCTLFSDSMML